MDILKRLTEPSTYAGLAALVAIISPSLGDLVPQIGTAIAAIIGGVLAIIAIVTPEKSA